MRAERCDGHVAPHRQLPAGPAVCAGGRGGTPRSELLSRGKCICARLHRRCGCAYPLLISLFSRRCVSMLIQLRHACLQLHQWRNELSDLMSPTMERYLSSEWDEIYSFAKRQYRVITCGEAKQAPPSVNPFTIEQVCVCLPPGGLQQHHGTCNVTCHSQNHCCTQLLVICAPCQFSGCGLRLHSRQDKRLTSVWLGSRCNECAPR